MSSIQDEFQDEYKRSPRDINAVAYLVITSNQNKSNPNLSQEICIWIKEYNEFQWRYQINDAKNS